MGEEYWKGREREQRDMQDLQVPGSASIRAAKEAHANCFPAGETEPPKVHIVDPRPEHDSFQELIGMSRASPSGA